MRTPFRVFPSVGYRNSQFQVVPFTDPLSVSLEFGGKTIKQLNLSDKRLAVLNRLLQPGTYTVSCQWEGSRFAQSFEVKNSFRMGTSHFKKAFTFEGIPYTFFVRNDRLMIYHEQRNELYEENSISPTNIRMLDDNHLLFITKFEGNRDQSSITNYAVYSLRALRIVFELVNHYQSITYQEPEKRLWLYNPEQRSIHCFCLDAASPSWLQEINTYPAIEQFKLVNDSRHLYAQTDRSLFVINTQKATAEEWPKTSHTALSEQGNLLVLKGEHLECHNLFAEGASKHLIKTPEELCVYEADFYWVGADFLTDEHTTAFEEAKETFYRQYTAALPETQTYLNLSISAAQEPPTFTFHRQELYAVEGGVLVLTTKTVRTLKSIKGRRDADKQWSCTLHTAEESTYAVHLYNGFNQKTILKNAQHASVLAYDYPTIVLKADKEVIVVKKAVLFREPLDTQHFSFYRTRGGLQYLWEKRNGVSTFSLITDTIRTKLREVAVLNESYLQSHGVVWYPGPVKKSLKELHYLSGYDLGTGKVLTFDYERAQHSLFEEVTAFAFEERYFLSSNEVLIHPQSAQVKDAALGHILYATPGLNKVLSRRNDMVYIHTFDAATNKYNAVQIKINSEAYSESYLSPKGDLLVLQKEPGKYTLLDIEKQEEVNFFSGNFLAFSQEGNLIIETDGRRSAKVLDPLTLTDITPPNYHYYRFLSPDGKLYSQLSMKFKYYDRVQQTYIEFADYQKLTVYLDGPFSLQEREKQKNQLEANKKAYWHKHILRLKELKINAAESLTAAQVVQIQKFTEIGIVGTTTTVEIRFPDDLQFYNYAAFSSDNKYFGYVGKPSLNGLIHLFRLEFDERQQTLKVVDDYLTRYPRWASWVCGFSKTGYFATYDSTPDTYILKMGEELYREKVSKEELRQELAKAPSAFLNTHKSWVEIKGKNFLCFSPSGRYMAISNQGYEPLTLGGHGHQECSALHIARTESGQLVYSTLEHGSQIKTNNSSKVVFVAFSEDEKRLMSMSQDGVVIIRNIDLN